MLFSLFVIILTIMNDLKYIISDTDGLGDTKPICGTIVAGVKDRAGRDAKVRQTISLLTCAPTV